MQSINASLATAYSQLIEALTAAVPCRYLVNLKSYKDLVAKNGIDRFKTQYNEFFAAHTYELLAANSDAFNEDSFLFLTEKKDKRETNLVKNNAIPVGLAITKDKRILVHLLRVCRFATPDSEADRQRVIEMALARAESSNNMLVSFAEFAPPAPNQKIREMVKKFMNMIGMGATPEDLSEVVSIMKNMDMKEVWNNTQNFFKSDKAMDDLFGEDGKLSFSRVSKLLPEKERTNKKLEKAFNAVVGSDIVSNILSIVEDINVREVVDSVRDGTFDLSSLAKSSSKLSNPKYERFSD